MNLHLVNKNGGHLLGLLRRGLFLLDCGSIVKIKRIIRLLRRLLLLLLLSRRIKVQREQIVDWVRLSRRLYLGASR